MKVKNTITQIALILLCFTVKAQNVSNISDNATSQNSINIKKMPFIGKVDERFQSFNIEMCEVIGGDF